MSQSDQARLDLGEGLTECAELVVGSDGRTERHCKNRALHRESDEIWCAFHKPTNAALRWDRRERARIQDYSRAAERAKTAQTDYLAGHKVRQAAERLGLDPLRVAHKLTIEDILVGWRHHRGGPVV